MPEFVGPIRHQFDTNNLGRSPSPERPALVHFHAPELRDVAPIADATAVLRVEQPSSEWRGLALALAEGSAAALPRDASEGRQRTELVLREWQIWHTYTSFYGQPQRIAAGAPPIPKFRRAAISFHGASNPTRRRR